MIFFPVDYTTLLVMCGASILGFTAGFLGVFAILREQSLMGDAISHAMLPGIVGSFMLTHSKNPLVLLAGGALSGIVGMICMRFIITTHLKKDTAFGIILSVFFGFGLLLMTRVQKLPLANQAILNKFLFGNASTLLFFDVLVIVVCCCLVLFFTILFFKEFVMISFDRNFAQVRGYSSGWIDFGLTCLLMSVIVLGLQMVGVVLMSTMIIAPAAAARQWTNRVGMMALVAGFVGLIAAIGGVIFSVSIPHLPTGPVIVVNLSVIVLFSLVCTARKKMVFAWIRDRWFQSKTL